jgi:hypothetical protein
MMSTLFRERRLCFATIEHCEDKPTLPCHRAAVGMGMKAQAVLDIMAGHGAVSLNNGPQASHFV